MAEPELDYLQMAYDAANLYGVPEDLFYSLVTQESEWNPEAGSEDGAYGLTQLMPETLKELGGFTMDDIRGNPRLQLDLGARYLSGLHERTGSWPMALGGYNAGMGSPDNPRVSYFDERGERHYVYDTPETQRYVLDIMERSQDPSSPDFFVREAVSGPRNEMGREELRRELEQYFPGVEQGVSPVPRPRPSGLASLWGR